MREHKTAGFIIIGLFLSALFSSLVQAAAPGKATLGSPSGQVTGSNITFTWSKVSGSTWYYLWVDDATGNKVKSWYTAEQAGCGAAGSRCSVTLSNSFMGQGQWWIRTWNSDGSGPWSDAMAFAVANDSRIPISKLPYTITTVGSYFITGDLTSTSDGIQVQTDNVTIDLMGFSLIGPGSGSNYGIYMHGRSNVEIKNGTIRNFGLDGILEAAQQTAKDHRVLNVRAVGNGRYGIALFGSGFQVKDCTASNNGDHGIFAGRGSVVTGNTAGNNGDDGIYGNGYNLIAGNVSRDNSGNGIFAAGGSTVTGNTAFNNGSDGVSAASGCTVAGNTAYSNSKDGISVTPGSYVGSTVAGNTAYQNGEDGISIGASARVSGNTAFLNQNYGISFAHSCLVDGNVATGNNQSGGSYTNLGPCAPCTYGTNHAP